MEDQSRGRGSKGGSEPFTHSYWPAEPSTEILDVTVGQVLRDAASECPDQLALVAGLPEPSSRIRFTYSELLTEAERVAHALLSRFNPGERVAVWAPNMPEWILLEFGAALAGIVLVTVNPAFKPGELDYVLRQSRASGIFHLNEFRGNPMAQSVEAVREGLPSLREAIALDSWSEFLSEADELSSLPEVQSYDPVQIQYTSGTTGFPKGAMLHHRGVTNNARLFAERVEVGRGDVWINPMPLFHTAGCVMAALGTVAQRAVHVPVLMFDPGLVLDLLESERGNFMVAVPTMLIALMEHPDFASRDLTSLRRVVSGGSNVPATLVRKIESTLGIQFGIIYGQTEASPVITVTRPDDSPTDKAETVGQPLPQTDVKVIDTNSGEVVSPGTVGELCTRGYHVMLGYYEMPEASSEAIDSEGWLHTGDLASMDDRGYFKIEGRLKDMIIRGGENIYPREIEEVLSGHSEVAETAVVGIPDEKWGEIVVAFVRRSEGSSVNAEELRSYVREKLAPHKTPVDWQFVESFPLTPSGKIQKFVLRDEYLKSNGGTQTP